MITPHEFYTVMTAVVPLYVAMILAYGSVRWWSLLTPAQCSGINRFVAIFAVPLLSFQIIAHNNPYEMNPRFVGADILQKLIVLAALALWASFKQTQRHRRPMTAQQQKGTPCLDWTITLFMVSTLPNTLVLGIPLEVAMYGEKPANLVVQAVVLQCIVWYTLLLFLFEYRSAKHLILEQFPGPEAAHIVSFRIDSDVVSLDGGPDQQIMTEAEIGGDGKIHVQVKRSPPPASLCKELDPICCKLRSPAYLSSPHNSSRPATPRASNLTGVEIYSLQSSRNLTPRGSSYNLLHPENLAATASVPKEAPTIDSTDDFPAYYARNFKSPSPRAGGMNLLLPEQLDFQKAARNKLEKLFIHNEAFSPMRLADAAKKMDGGGTYREHHTRDVQMLVWSANSSPVSEKASNSDAKLTSSKLQKHLSIEVPSDSTPLHQAMEQHDFNYVDNVLFQQGEVNSNKSKLESSSPLPSKVAASSGKLTAEQQQQQPQQSTPMPPATVMTSLILRMMWRKLVRNPNTYASLLGLSWALISYRWNFGMPKLVEHSITILSDAGLGMAMFSLGLFMALQSKILACGTTMAVVVMIIRFVTGPAIMSATSIAIGLRNAELRASIIQAALPQGIVPFVFAREYNVHPDVLSTAVIFGMLISLPINLLYYVLLGL